METRDKATRRQGDEGMAGRRTGHCRSEPTRHRETAAEPEAILPSRERTAQRKMGVRGQGSRERAWGPIPSRLHPPMDSRGMWVIYITCRAAAQASSRASQHIWGK